MKNHSLDNYVKDFLKKQLEIDSIQKKSQKKYIALRNDQILRIQLITFNERSYEIDYENTDYLIFLKDYLDFEIFKISQI